MSGPNVYEVPTLGGEPRLLQRGASRGRISPDGLWLACVPHDAAGIRIAARGGAGFRTVASRTGRCGVRDVVAGQPVRGRPCPSGSGARAGLVDRADGRRSADRTPGWSSGSARPECSPCPPGRRGWTTRWCSRRLGVQGVSLYRQRIVPSTFQPAGAPERLTAGSESAWLPTAAAGRLAFLSSRADANLWSVALDAASGIAHGPLRRMTRGPAPLGFLSVTNDFRTLAYFSFRLGHGDVFLRDLQTGSERVLADGPAGEKGYPAISPSGSLLAYGTRMPEASARYGPSSSSACPTGPGERWVTIAAAGRASGWMNAGSSSNGLRA